MSAGPELQQTLDLLREIAAKPIKIGPVELSPEYLKRVEQVEQLPSNQDGVDKTWLWEAFERDRLHFETARLVRKQ